MLLTVPCVVRLAERRHHLQYVTQRHDAGELAAFTVPDQCISCILFNDHSVDSLVEGELMIQHNDPGVVSQCLDNLVLAQKLSNDIL